MLSSVPPGDGQEKDLAVGDFNRDGWMDVVVVRKAPFSNPGGRTDLLLMNVDGVLRDRTAEDAPEFLTILSDARDVVVADLDGDEWLDLVMANTFGQQPHYYRNLGEDGGGNWLGFAEESAARFPILTIPKLQFCAVTAGDVTGNGAPDLYFCNYVKAPDIAQDVLLVNDGTGHFTDQSEVRLGDRRNSAFGTSIELRDMDNGGDRDIVKTSSLDPVPPWNAVGIFIVFNDGAGIFRDYQSVPSESPYMFTVEDFTNDGLLDLYVVNDSQDFMVTCVGIDSSSAEPLEFAKVVLDSPRTSFLGGNLRGADFDGDGDLDVAVADVDIDLGVCENEPGDLRKFALLRNDGGADGMLVDPWGSEMNVWNRNVFDFAVLDLDRDGKLDIVAGLCDGYAVWRQENTLHLPERSVEFGDVIVGTGSPHALRVCNNGTEPVAVTGISTTDLAFEVHAAGFTLQPFECRDIEVEFVPPVPGSYAATLVLEGEVRREVALSGTALAPPVAVWSEEAIAVRLPAGRTLRRHVSLANTGGSVLRYEVRIRVPEEPKVLLMGDPEARPSVEAALEEMAAFYDVGELAAASLELLEGYDTLLVALVPGEVTPEEVQFLADALRAGKTVVILGASTDPDFLAGLQGLLTHRDVSGWKFPASPHFRVVDVDHPLADGLPIEYDFVGPGTSWYRVQPDDEDAWVAAENGDGVPSLLSKRVSEGLLVYFTNWALSVSWSDPADGVILRTVLQNAIGLKQRAWVSVRPRFGGIEPAGSVQFDLVFHAAGYGAGSRSADLVITTNDFLQEEIVVPITLDVLEPPESLPEIRVRTVEDDMVRLDLWGRDGTRYRLERTEDLQNWVPGVEVTVEAGVAELDVPRGTTERAAYYRAVETGD